MSDARQIYRIKNWAVHFEVAQARRCKEMKWVSMPNRHDGKSLKRLLKQQNGMAIYGAWSLIVQVASKCPVRGVLADDDGPLNSVDLADKTGGTPSVFELALSVLCGASIGWLEVVPAEEAQSVLADVWAHFDPTRSGLRADSERARTPLNPQNQTRPDQRNEARSPRDTAALFDDEREPLQNSITGAAVPSGPALKIWNEEYSRTSGGIICSRPDRTDIEALEDRFASALNQNSEILRKAVQRFFGDTTGKFKSKTLHVFLMYADDLCQRAARQLSEQKNYEAQARSRAEQEARARLPYRPIQSEKRESEPKPLGDILNQIGNDNGS